MQHFLLFLILIPLIKIIFSFEFITNTLNFELNQISVTKLLIYLPTAHRQERERERKRGRERGGRRERERKRRGERGGRRGRIE